MYITPCAIDANGKVTATAAENISDSTFVFTHIPKGSTSLAIEISGKILTKDIPDSATMVTIPIDFAAISHQLDDVVVESKNQYVIKNKTVYTPQLQDKKIAGDATSLLRLMAIPKLKIDIRDNSVSTIAGDGVSIFIDYLPANTSDIENMRTLDVARVEVIDFPADARFKGARHVVNFIMHKYEYGGYTKLSINQGFVDNRGTYQASSKLTYKKMTYDFTARYNYTNDKHNALDTKSSYKFADYDITRIEETQESHNENRNGHATMRAVYNSDKTVISNTFGVELSKIPDNYSSKLCTFLPQIYEPSTYEQQESSRSVAPTWSGNYNFILPNNFSLSISPSASYGHFNNSYYYSQARQNIVENKVKEDAWKYDASAMLTKNFRQNFSGFASAGGGGRCNNINYYGTTPAYIESRYNYAGITIGANYWLQNLWFQGNATLSYNHYSNNGETINETTPKYFISMGYMFNDHSSLSASSEMSYFSIPANQKAPNTILLNQIDAITGNAGLKTYRYNSVNVTYQNTFNKKLSMAMFGHFSRFNKPIAYLYTPIEIYNQGPIMLRSIINDGFKSKISFGASLTYRPFDGMLLSGSVSEESHIRRGIQHYTSHRVYFNLQANYSIRNVYFGLYFQNGKKYCSTVNWAVEPNTYQFNAGWSNGTWNVNASIRNPFSDSWKGRRAELYSSNFSTVEQRYTSSYHRAFQIAVSYTFNYGKKIKRTNDLGKGNAVESGQLR